MEENTDRAREKVTVKAMGLNDGLGCVSVWPVNVFWDSAFCLSLMSGSPEGRARTPRSHVPHRFLCLHPCMTVLVFLAVKTGVETKWVSYMSTYGFISYLMSFNQKWPFRVDIHLFRLKIFDSSFQVNQLFISYLYFCIKMLLIKLVSWTVVLQPVYHHLSRNFLCDWRGSVHDMIYER